MQINLCFIMEKTTMFLNYDPKTGEFIRIKSSSKKVKIGELAGTKNSNGYWQIYVSGKVYLAHRLAWFFYYKEIPKEIDHINRNRLDNRISNLREACRSDNAQNQAKRKNNTSGIKNIHYHNSSKKWVARCRMGGKRIFIGRYETKELAGDALFEFLKTNKNKFYCH